MKAEVLDDGVKLELSMEEAVDLWNCIGHACHECPLSDCNDCIVTKLGELYEVIKKWNS